MPPASGGHPPPIVARPFDTTQQQEAWQGSYCWGNTCSDSIAPPWDALPLLGATDTVEVGFAAPGDWTVTLGTDGRPCATYPVLLLQTGPNTYDFAPTGPADEYRLDVFIYPESGGDTSGAFRWTTPGPDGPTAWAHLHQNTEFSGGMGVVQVVLDGAAVDGNVTGTVTVSGADASETFRLTAYDQGCRGDHYVTLAPPDPVDQRVDGLGAGPYTYDVDLVVDGMRHQATAVSPDDAEDTTLVFDPPLPE